ncbi:MAG TPA: glutamate--cysteine ligase [Pseudonocardiaceae bacterium]|nr:glutamate--cysteine ligase [Pseudonocardiaceae bacterium]
MGEELTVGVEEEFLLVGNTGQLSFTGPALIGETEGQDGKLQKELGGCQVESATSVCRTADEITGQLRNLRVQLAEAARSHSARLVPTGTPILAQAAPMEITPDTRYHKMTEHFGAITYTASTCGCHVHVSVPDRATCVQVSNRLRPWLPLLLALTANSPFNAGQDTAYSSWRHILWSRWPSAGPPPLFTSLDHYESSVAAMLQAGAMLDRGMIYWDIRLSEHHPTLEFRGCDVAATVEDAALVAVLIRGLVARALEDLACGQPALTLPHEVLRANLWRAARDGFTGSCLEPSSGNLLPVHVQIQRLVQQLRPILEDLGDLEFVEANLARLHKSGDGAHRQRLAYQRRHNLQDVIDLLAVSN